MKRTNSLLVVAWFAVIYSGCSQNVPDKIEKAPDEIGKVPNKVDKIGFGTLENDVYQNAYFGMMVKLPKDWYALDDEARKAAMQKGKTIVTGQDTNLEAVLDANELNTVNLLMAFEYPPGTPVPFNPSVACVAEKVGHLPGVKKGSDYLYHMKQLMERSRLHYDFVGDIYSKEIGGVSFDVQATELKTGTLRIRQEYCGAIMKGYALAFVLSSTTKEEGEAIEQALKGVRFREP